LRQVQLNANFAYRFLRNVSCVKQAGVHCFIDLELYYASDYDQC